jgi:hypothetical protein
MASPHERTRASCQLKPTYAPAPTQMHGTHEQLRKDCQQHPVSRLVRETQARPVSQGPNPRSSGAGWPIACGPERPQGGLNFEAPCRRTTASRRGAQ